MKKVGYVREIAGQNTREQAEKLWQYGCQPLFHGEAIKEAMEAASVGGVLVIPGLVHLAQSFYQLAQVIRELDHKGIRLVVLDQGLDSSNADMYQSILAVAEFERSLINERIAEGVAKAKAAGVKFGRKEKLTAAELENLRQEFNTAGVNKAELAKKYGLHRSSLYRLGQQNNGKNE